MKAPLDTAAISCDIVTRRHGGSIDMESRVGEFAVRLPRRTGLRANGEGARTRA